MNRRMLRYFMEKGYIEAEDLPELVEDGVVEADLAEAILECDGPKHDVATGHQNPGSDWAVRKGSRSEPSRDPALKAKAKTSGGAVKKKGEHEVLSTESARDRFLARIREREEK